MLSAPKPDNAFPASPPLLMRKKPMRIRSIVVPVLFVSLLAALPAPLAAQDEASGSDRGQVQAEWPEGKAVLSYGRPKWNDAFKEQMTEGFVWRLGNNEPTSLAVTCGLMTAAGPVPPGEYKLACRCAAPDEWRLLVYRGTGLYEDGVKTWEIKPEATDKNHAKTAILEIGISGPRKLQVRFGPYSVVYPFVPVKAHPPCETEFAGIGARVDVLAIPVPDGPVKDLCIGVASAETAAGPVRWDLRLTVDGEKPILTFTNERPTAITKEKATLEKRVERIKAHIAEVPEEKDRLEKFAEEVNAQIKALDDEARANSRFHPSHSVEGRIEPREKPASELDFSHDRPTGRITFTFGVRGQNCIFDVNPRRFQVPRQRQGG
jgi:hypothetical protein